MKKKIVIKYHWTCNEGIEIPEGHKEALEEDALNRIFEMVSQGNWEGELSTSVRYGKDVIPEEDEDDGLNYSGWWFFKRKK
jgi:hypothetical protein